LKLTAGVNVAKQWLFDLSPARDLSEARQKFIEEFVGEVREQTELASATDVGCGLGLFSKLLQDMNFRVIGVDGREENVREAQARYPGITFLVANAEDLPVKQMGAFDLVLCLGLLYHLENPFRAIRHLRFLTGKVLLVEGMCVPSDFATMELLDELEGEDQGLDRAAFYPSEFCLIKMLYRADFPFVYRFKRLPNNELYRASVWRKRVRTFLAASTVPLMTQNLVLAEDRIRLAYKFDPWATSLSRLRGLSKRLRTLLARGSVRVSRFGRRPWGEKREILSWYARRFWRGSSAGGTK
jgi:SAM-dependent methyltransferase